MSSQMQSLKRCRIHSNTKCVCSIIIQCDQQTRDKSALQAVRLRLQTPNLPKPSHEIRRWFQVAGDDHSRLMLGILGMGASTRCVFAQSLLLQLFADKDNSASLFFADILEKATATIAEQNIEFARMLF